MDSQPLRRFLCDIAHQLKRNKALSSLEGWYVAAIDGHEFFSSRKRCCPDCQKRTLTVDGQAVTEYYQRPDIGLEIQGFFVYPLVLP